jgi:hypothetical protein
MCVVRITAANDCMKNPNREVGDVSLGPTGEAAAILQIPQPEGWG